MAVTGAMRKNSPANRPSPAATARIVSSHGQGKPTSIDKAIWTAIMTKMNRASVRPSDFHKTLRNSGEKVSRNARSAAPSILSSELSQPHRMDGVVGTLAHDQIGPLPCRQHVLAQVDEIYGL